MTGSMDLSKHDIKCVFFVINAWNKGWGLNFFHRTSLPMNLRLSSVTNRRK